MYIEGPKLVHKGHAGRRVPYDLMKFRCERDGVGPR